MVLITDFRGNKNFFNNPLLSGLKFEDPLNEGCREPTERFHFPSSKRALPLITSRSAPLTRFALPDVASDKIRKRETTWQDTYFIKSEIINSHSQQRLNLAERRGKLGRKRFLVYSLKIAYPFKKHKEDICFACHDLFMGAMQHGAHKLRKY